MFGCTARYSYYFPLNFIAWMLLYVVSFTIHNGLFCSLMLTNPLACHFETRYRTKQEQLNIDVPKSFSSKTCRSRVPQVIDSGNKIKITRNDEKLKQYLKAMP